MATLENFEDKIAILLASSQWYKPRGKQKSNCTQIVRNPNFSLFYIHFLSKWDASFICATKKRDFDFWIHLVNRHFCFFFNILNADFRKITSTKSFPEQFNRFIVHFWTQHLHCWCGKSRRHIQLIISVLNNPKMKIEMDHEAVNTWNTIYVTRIYVFSNRFLY